MAEIYQLRDYQRPEARLRTRHLFEKKLEAEAIEIANLAFPSVFGFSDGIDGMYVTESDPA